MIGVHLNDTACVDYDELDPGIRNTVRMLRAAGFRTTDSGDGASKFGTDKEACAEPIPNVYMVIDDPAQLVSESRRLVDLLRSRLQSPALLEATELVGGGQEVPRVFIEGIYSPTDDLALLSIHGISDADLAPGATA